jgi:hypothetical protein
LPGVIERELGVEDPADESSAKTSCCGHLLDAVPSFCGWGLEGAEELQRSANESDMGDVACNQLKSERSASNVSGDEQEAVIVVNNGEYAAKRSHDELP